MALPFTTTASNVRRARTRRRHGRLVAVDRHEALETVDRVLRLALEGLGSVVVSCVHGAVSRDERGIHSAGADIVIAAGRRRGAPS
jgi:hypothetical protein